MVAGRDLKSQIPNLKSMIKNIYDLKYNGSLPRQLQVAGFGGVEEGVGVVGGGGVTPGAGAGLSGEGAGEGLVELEAGGAGGEEGDDVGLGAAGDRRVAR